MKTPCKTFEYRLINDQEGRAIAIEDPVFNGYTLLRSRAQVSSFLERSKKAGFLNDQEDTVCQILFDKWLYEEKTIFDDLKEDLGDAIADKIGQSINYGSIGSALRNLLGKS